MSGRAYRNQDANLLAAWLPGRPRERPQEIAEWIDQRPSFGTINVRFVYCEGLTLIPPEIAVAIVALGSKKDDNFVGGFLARGTG